MYPIGLVVSSVLLVGGVWMWCRLHRLQRVVRVERAAVRLTEAAHHRDLTAFQRRIDAAMAVQAAEEAERLLLAAMDRIVTAEYARATHNPHEGDPK